MKRKQSRKVRRHPKAAGRTRGGVEADTHHRKYAGSMPGKNESPASGFARTTSGQTALLTGVGVAPGPRAPSPLDQLLADLHLRGTPVPRESAMQKVQQACEAILSKYVGEVNECEKAEGLGQ